jgi:antitoxin (DNA-binding transcriptional repressor) of toxin-antitoxin stability system
MVKAGEEIIITDRGKPVAKIVPLKRDDLEMPPHLKELERAGLIRMGRGTINKSFWELPRPNDPKGSALKALMEEREEWR